MRYTVKEIFYSLQGEGVRAGEPSVFLRFAGCNLDCKKATHGFDCDTDFSKGKSFDLNALVQAVVACASVKQGPRCDWVILTGGEPALQTTPQLLDALHAEGFFVAIETNGTRELPEGIDWICVSPKVPDAQVKQLTAHEVKFVVKAGDPIPTTRIQALHYLVSPAFEVESKSSLGGECTPENLAHAIALCLQNPPWRLSEQRHKHWRVR